jgi:EmrB/QacA subfamily drug resistance transporter
MFKLSKPQILNYLLWKIYIVQNNEQPQTKNPNQGLLTICIAAFLVPFMSSSLNLALPQISEAFSMKAVHLTWISTSYIISTAIFQIPFAKIADSIGREKVFICGVFIFSFCNLLCGFATAGYILIALRFLSGLGSAMMFGTNLAILISLATTRKRAKMLAINTVVVSLALNLGPFMGGSLTHYYGWQSIFYFCAAFGFIVVVLGFLFLERVPRKRISNFDFSGFLAYAIGLFSLIYGLSNLPQATGIFCTVLGLLAFGLFVYLEKQHSNPIFDLKLLSNNKVFALSVLAMLIHYAATAAIVFMLSLYLQYIRGFDAVQAGSILIIQSIFLSASAIVVVKVADRFNPSTLTTFAMGVVVVGVLGLIFISTTTPLWFLFLLLSIMGIGFGIFSSPNSNVIMSSVEKRNYNQASAIIGTMRNIGQAISMAIATTVIALEIGQQKITPEVYPEFMVSFKNTFIIFAVLCSIGIYAASVRNRNK